MAEHSLTQIPCWCARPRFPGSSAVARDRPQAVRTGLGPQQWDDRDRRAMAVRGAARRAECPHSRAAARQGRRPHCGDRCCRVLRMLDRACDCCCRAHRTAPETRTSANAVPPANTLRDRRVTGGRSGRSRNERAISSARLRRGRIRTTGASRFGYQSRRPPVASDDPDLLLRVATKSQLGRGKQPIDDQHVTIGSVVDDFGLAVRTDDKQRRHLSLNDAG